MDKQRRHYFQQTGENGALLCERRGLSPREQQILDLIGQGKTTKEIATILNLSTATIGNHRKSICHKWNIHSTAEFVYRAGLGR